MPWNCHTTQGTSFQDETTAVSPVGEAQRDTALNRQSCFLTTYTVSSFLTLSQQRQVSASVPERKATSDGEGEFDRTERTGSCARQVPGCQPLDLHSQIELGCSGFSGS